MAHISLDVGPVFNLNSKELEELVKFNEKEIPLNGAYRTSGKIELTDDMPNRKTLLNGAYEAIDPDCTPEFYLERDVRKGISRYSLKIHKDSFLRMVEGYRKNNLELIGSRCRFDRFAVNILFED